MRTRSLLSRSRVEKDLDKELRFHLDQQTEENLAGGMTPDDARYAAIRRLGGAEQTTLPTWCKTFAMRRGRS